MYMHGIQTLFSYLKSNQRPLTIILDYVPAVGKGSDFFMQKRVKISRNSVIAQ
ncbi:hypothetical protein Sjap_009407 [Stephania japonica]|uniref:Uncharacterized protein n=1 Tax=Stephania japonica TaxID=461633 RepID=A0AAP0JSU9_9MAGN